MEVAAGAGNRRRRSEERVAGGGSINRGEKGVDAKESSRTRVAHIRTRESGTKTV